MAHVLVELLCLCRLPRVIANVTGQLIVLILIGCCMLFFIGWATTSISAPFRAVFAAFPPSTFVLHTVQISLEFNLVALLWNLTNLIFLTFSLLTLIHAYSHKHVHKSLHLVLVLQLSSFATCAQVRLSAEGM